jgi:hypothetical protein
MLVGDKEDLPDKRRYICLGEEQECRVSDYAVVRSTSHSKSVVLCIQSNTGSLE